MNWYRDQPGKDRFTIYDLYSIIYYYGKYSVENSSLGCQLTVREVKLSDAASYVCQLKISEIVYEASAQLYAFSKF